MLFVSLFKTLVGKEVTVELKNDVQIKGILHSVDQFMNIKLSNISVVDEAQAPYLAPVTNCFVRGSVIRYVQVPGSAVKTDLLQEATRREFLKASKDGTGR